MLDDFVEPENLRCPVDAVSLRFCEKVDMRGPHRSAVAALTLVAGLVGLGACSAGDDAGSGTTQSGVLEDIADQVGLSNAPGTTRTYGALVFDYDNDGWSDVLVGRHDFSAVLMRNDHGRFVPSPAIPFAAPRGTDRHSCVGGDVNGDGRVDVYCTVGGARGVRAKPTPNELWIQRADGTFVDDGARPDLADPYGRGRQPALFDVDRDGDLDLVVGNGAPRWDGQESRNRVFLNDGAAGWRSAPELGLDFELSIGVPKGNTPAGCLEVLDADGDGWLDVLMCAQSAEQDRLHTYLFRNEQGRKFRDATEDLRLGGEAFDAAIFDYDGDGDADVATVDSEGLTVRVQRDDGYEAALQVPVEHARRVAVADVNDDGRPDFYLMRDAKPDRQVDDLLLLSKESDGELDPVDVPPASGNGNHEDDVVPIDHDRDGRSEFLVLNGLNGFGDRRQDRAAPLQLVAFRAGDNDAAREGSTDSLP